MHNASADFLDEFWGEFQNLWVSLYGSRLLTIAAIAGESLAGGCIISLACDHRIIVSTAKIGLNEAAFGLVAPPWTAQTMIDVVGRRVGERALCQGTVFSATEAVRIGLADRLVITIEDDMQKKIELMNLEAEKDALLSMKAPGRAATKKMIRQENLSKLATNSNRSHDTQIFKDCVLNPKVQEMLGKYLSSLSSKKK
jgi:3,2-trans-enoyl-CoA isomerase